MEGYLKRLAASGLAYQSASLLSGFLALFTLPLYTRHLSRADFGYAETLLTLVILTSILLRFGMGEAFVRTWFDDEHPDRRRHLARTTTTFVLVSTTIALVAGVLLAGPLSRLILGTRNETLMAYGIFGIWAFTNLEIAYALLRVEERRRAYLIASSVNVILTVILTVVLVVVLDDGARGYVLGNYAASAVVLAGLWAFVVREHVGIPRVRVRFGPLLRYGAPTVPADAAVFLLNVVDRAYLLRADSPAAAGLYSVAIKLATVVIVLVRGFQLAWPPLVFSVEDDAEASRIYARVTTTYIVFTGLIVAGFVLLGRWVVRLLAAPSFFDAHKALPWVALGWALYGLYLVLASIAGRQRATIRTLPSALVGVAVNVGGARLARPAARHHGRGDRALRGLRGDAGRAAPPDAQAVPRPVRVGAHRRAGARGRRPVAGRRPAAADGRPGRPRLAGGRRAAHPCRAARRGRRPHGRAAHAAARVARASADRCGYLTIVNPIDAGAAARPLWLGVAISR